MKYRDTSAYGLLDLMFNLALSFVFLLIVAIMLISEQKKKDVERPAEFLITMTWHDQSEFDVDMHVLHDTTQSWVHYNAKRVNHMSLELDDRGKITDSYKDPDTGVELYTSINREVVTIRQKIKGTYTVNVHLFSPVEVVNALKYDVGNDIPLPVHVEVLQLNPYKIIHTGTVFLNKAKEQRTAVSFLVEDGKVTTVDAETQTPFVYQGLGLPNSGPGLGQ